MTEQKATNVHWHEGEIQREHRHQLLGQQGATLWFTGLSGSGKSTVAVALEEALHLRGKLAYRLDGDNIRLGINKNLGFSASAMLQVPHPSPSTLEILTSLTVNVELSTM